MAVNRPTPNLATFSLSNFLTFQLSNFLTFQLPYGFIRFFQHPVQGLLNLTSLGLQIRPRGIL